jgi:hypothetical protein
MQTLIDYVRVLRHYRRDLGRYPNLLRPTRFSEKIQVAKLRWRSPRMVALADKVLAKRIVAARLGPEWVTPTLYAGPTLPPRSERNWPVPYVIKANNWSGGNYFVTGEPDWDEIEPRVERWRSKTYGRSMGEWVYRAMRPQLLVEPYIGGTEPPVDYRLFVFNGRVEMISVNWNFFSGQKRAVYDGDWNRLPFVMANGVEPDHGPDVPPPPASYPEMVRGARELASGFPFARVDLYEIDGRPRFGEVTFYPSSGFVRLPEEYDLRYGALWPDGLPA